MLCLQGLFPQTRSSGDEPPCKGKKDLSPLWAMPALSLCAQQQASEGTRQTAQTSPSGAVTSARAVSARLVTKAGWCPQSLVRAGQATL